MENDYYEILGIPRGASREEIRTTYKKLAQKYHPDKSKRKTASEKKFKEASEAYSVLSDKKKKAEYDKEYDAEHESRNVGEEDEDNGEEVTSLTQVEKIMGNLTVANAQLFIFGSITSKKNLKKYLAEIKIIAEKYVELLEILNTEHNADQTLQEYISKQQEYNDAEQEYNDATNSGLDFDPEKIGLEELTKYLEELEKSINYHYLTARNMEKTIAYKGEKLLNTLAANVADLHTDNAKYNKDQVANKTKELREMSYEVKQNLEILWILMAKPDVNNTEEHEEFDESGEYEEEENDSREISSPNEYTITFTVLWLIIGILWAPTVHEMIPGDLMLAAGLTALAIAFLLDMVRNSVS